MRCSLLKPGESGTGPALVGTVVIPPCVCQQQGSYQRRWSEWESERDKHLQRWQRHSDLTKTKPTRSLFHVGSHTHMCSHTCVHTHIQTDIHAVHFCSILTLCLNETEEAGWNGNGVYSYFDGRSLVHVAFLLGTRRTVQVEQRREPPQPSGSCHHE